MVEFLARNMCVAVECRLWWCHSGGFLIEDWGVQIAKLEELEQLDVSYSAVTGKGLLVVLHGCPLLKTAKVDGCHVSTLSMLRAIHRRPKLRLWDKGPLLHPYKSQPPNPGLCVGIVVGSLNYRYKALVCTSMDLHECRHG